MFEIARITSEAARCGECLAHRRASRPSRWRAFSRYVADNWTLLFLALPGVILVFLLRYVPLFGTVMAFQDYRLGQGFLSPWVGLKNFDVLFRSPVLGRIVRNTLVLNSMFIVAGTGFAVLVALLLNEVRSSLLRRLLQWVMFLPFFMGWSLVAMVLYGLFDYEVGTLNVLLGKLGWQRVAITNAPALWPWLLTAISIWKGTGSGCIVYLAVLVGVNPELYEAAAIDGAGYLQRMRYVSLPSLLPTIITLTLIAIGRIFFGNWGMIYALVGGQALLYPTTDVIDTYILRALQSSANFGLSAAVGLFQSLLSFVLVYGTNWLTSKHFGYSLF